ncbi:efflux RND transporter permease subunit [bacterium]|nr:efflux RND transporter permease subunit [bacterium]
MILSDLSVRRPVTAVMMTLGLVMVGILGYRNLEVREVPDVELPIVTVTAALPGASPEVVETEITDVIEEAVNTIEGIKSLTSVSGEGVATVTVEFNLERDVDLAAQDVRDKIGAARRLLPDDMDEPQISKLDLNAQAIMWLALTSDRLSNVELTDYAERVLKERIQRMPGVGSLIIGGSRKYAVRAWLDAQKMAAMGVTSTDIVQAFREEHVEIPSGRIESNRREFVVKTEGEFSSVAEMNDLVLAVRPASGTPALGAAERLIRQGVPVRLRDVGHAEDGITNYRSLARFNRRPSVGLGVLKQSKANTVDVARRIKDLLPELQKEFPEGMRIQPAFDSSQYIENSIQAIREDFLLGGFFAGAVIFFFLLSVKSTLIAAIAIPTSIISTFAAMYYLGFSLNNFTFLALSVSVGVVIDDAIVVLENIYRHMEEGRPRMEAAVEGAREISGAAIAATLAIFAIFIPVAFMPGMIGRFFHEFGMTISIAVLISLFIALSLTPMLCSRTLSVGHPTFGPLRAIDRFWEIFTAGYKRSLAFSLRYRLPVLILGAATLAGSFGILRFYLKTEFFPQEDKGSFVVNLEAPQGATFEYMDRYQRQAEDIAAGIPEINTFFSAIGLAQAGSPSPRKGIMFVRLKARHERARGQAEVITELRRKLSGITGVVAYVIPIPTVRIGRADAALQYLIQTGDFEALKKYEAVMVEKMKHIPGLVDVDSDLDLNKPELKLEIDRKKAADLGLSVRDIAATLQVLLGEDDVAKFKLRGKRYDVIPQLDEKFRRDPEAIDRIHVRARDGKLVQMSNVVRRIEGVGPDTINRHARERSVRLTANLAPGKTLGEALKEVERLAKETLPDGFRTMVVGQSREFQESMQSLLFAFVLALLMAYMVLAAQYESLIHPLTVMLSLPLALIGGLGGLALLGQTMNLFSAIGIITLMGISKKNAILLVDFAISRQREGVAAKEAMLAAGPVRLRPILMTSVAMICGVLPIILSTGAGSEVRRPMGIATGFGMVSSTLLSLYVVPVIYTLIEDARTLYHRMAGRVSG